MKHFRSTWILFAVVALLAGYTYYEYRHASEDLEFSKGEMPAFGLKREDVDKISLTVRGAAIELQKKGNEWLLVKPVEDFAESAVVDGFLFSAVTQKFKTFRSDDDGKGQAINWAEFGLDSPAITLELTAKGKAESLAFGSKNAFDGSYYVRKGNDVYLGDKSLAQVVDRQPFAFRSRKIWRDEDVTLESVIVDNGKEKFAFKKNDGKWAMDPAPAYAIDSSRMEDWLNRVQDLVPTEFVKEGVEDVDKANYLLKKPALTVQVSYKKKDGKDGKWTLTLGQEKATEVFLYTDQRPTIYKATKAATEKLLVSKDYFRDGHAPFQFNVEQARVIRIHTPALNHEFKKVDSGWALSDKSSAELELNQDKLVQLLQSLRTLDAREFLANGPGIKGEPQIQILGEDQKPIFTLAWSDEYKSKLPWNVGVALRYAKSNLSKEIVALPKDKIERLIDSGMVKKKAPEAPVKK